MTAAPAVIFALIGPLSQSRSASEVSVGCGGHSFSFFQDNSLPFLHFSRFLVIEALIAREA